MMAAVGSEGGAPEREGTRQRTTLAPAAGGIVALEVEGAAITYWRAPREGAARMVLVHGGAGHWGWWRGMLPRLCHHHHYDVAAVDLSGHGDSEHRAAYGLGTWAREIAAVIEHGGAPAWVVGHSMGGRVGAHLAAVRPELVRGVILVDSMLPYEPETVVASSRRPVRRSAYPSKDALLARFRLSPPETLADPALFAQVAEQAICEVAGGWSWKFDPGIFGEWTDEGEEPLGAELPPIGYVYAGHSPICGPQNLGRLEELLERRIPAVEVAGTYHHLMLDDPERCVEAVEATIAALEDTAATTSGEPLRLRLRERA